MKKYLIGICKSAAILAAGVIIGVMLLCAALCVPNNPDIKEESLGVIGIEGLYPLANYLHNFSDKYFTSYRPGVLDNGTDGLVIMPRVFLECGENILYDAVYMEGYSRYWHGYVAVLRPIMFFMDYWDFRILNFLLQVSLIVCISFLLWDQFKCKKYVLALWTSYFLLTPIALSMSLQYSPCFYIAYGGVAFVLIKRDWLAERQRYFYFFLILGMLTSYFDLLTYPLVTWALPLIWWLASPECNDAVWQRFRKTVLSAIGWIAGYGCFWALKWVISSIVLGSNHAGGVAEQISERTGDVPQYAQRLLHAYERWESLYANWRHYEYGLYAIIIVAWMLWALYHIATKRWRFQLSSASYLLIAMSPLVWYLTLSNHTTIHHFFTHRIYVAGIMAFIMFLLKNTCDEPVQKNTAGRKRMAVSIVLWGVSVAIGIICITFAREDIEAIYGIEYRPVKMSDGDIVTVRFQPTFNQLRNIGFCACSESGDGLLEIKVVDMSVGGAGRTTKCLEIPASEFTETTYYQEAIKWVLEPSTQYMMSFSYHGRKDGSGMELFVTNPGNMPLNEYSDMNVNGTDIEGQPLGSFTYHPHIQSRLFILYNAGLCAVFVGSVMQTLYIFFCLIYKKILTKN